MIHEHPENVNNRKSMEFQMPCRFNGNQVEEPTPIRSPLLHHTKLNDDFSWHGRFTFISGGAGAKIDIPYSVAFSPKEIGLRTQNMIIMISLIVFCIIGVTYMTIQ